MGYFLHVGSRSVFVNDEGRYYGSVNERIELNPDTLEPLDTVKPKVAEVEVNKLTREELEKTAYNVLRRSYKIKQERTMKKPELIDAILREYGG